MTAPAEPRNTRLGEQMFLQVGDATFHWLLRPSWDDAWARAKDEAARTGLTIRVRGRVRMNDYVGSPRWGEYRDYKEHTALNEYRKTVYIDVEAASEDDANGLVAEIAEATQRTFASVTYFDLDGPIENITTAPDDA